jgi:membrane protein involved in colicin uptake
VPLPDLDSKTVEELEALLVEDSPKFEELIGEIAAVRESVKLRDEMRDSAIKTAKANQDELERIEALQREVETKRQEAAAARARFEEKAQRKREIEQESSPLALMKRLAEAAKVADEESDAVAQRFLAGELTPAEFVKQYKEKRMVFHTRSAKRESLATATVSM